MAAEENKALVRRLLEAVRDSWSPAVIDEFFATDYRRHLNATTPPITADQHVTVPVFAIVRIADSKLVEEWGGLDQANLFGQLGVSAIRDS